MRREFFVFNVLNAVSIKISDQVLRKSTCNNTKQMSNQFITKIATWIADRLIVDGLAKSKGFQKFAQKTHTNVQKAKAKIKEVPNTVKGEVKEGEQSGFFAQFKAARNDISKEINSAKDQLKREIDAEYKK